MNIDDLTVGDLKKIAALAQVLNLTEKARDTTGDHIFADAIGKYVVVRSHMAGCFCGVLKSATLTGDTIVVVLTDARKMWRWWAVGGCSIEQVAAKGVEDRKEVIFSASVAVQPVAGCMSLSTCSAESEAILRAVPVRRA